jgi:hypothetical protein
MSGEFSVAEFYSDGTHKYVVRHVVGVNAVMCARLCIDSAASNVERIIITDGGDDTNFEWKRGEGVTFPKAEE